MLTYRLGRREVVLTAAQQWERAAALASPDPLDGIVLVADRVCRARRLHADIAVLTVDARFSILESSVSEHQSVEEHPLDSDLFVAALLLMEPAEVLSTTTKILKNKSIGNATIGQDFQDRYRWARRLGHVWDAVAGEISVPLVRQDGTSFAIRLASRDGASRSHATFLTAIREMRAEKPILFPDLAG